MTEPHNLAEEIDSQQDPRVALMADVHDALSTLSRYWEGETEIRSAVGSDTVDVLVDGQWYRISAEPINQPITLEQHGTVR